MLKEGGHHQEETTLDFTLLLLVVSLYEEPYERSTSSRFRFFAVFKSTEGIPRGTTNVIYMILEAIFTTDSYSFHFCRGLIQNPMWLFIFLRRNLVKLQKKSLRRTKA